MSMMWVGIGTAVAGTATSLYGANKQSKAIASAQDQNYQQFQEQQDRNWNNYLMQRGINTGGAAKAGEIPASSTAVNTRLPLWMTVRTGAAPAAATPGGTTPRRRLVPIGSSNTRV